GDRDQGLHLLEQDRREHAARADNRLCEEDRRDRRRSGADDDSCEHVARPRAPQLAQRREEQGQGQNDEDNVFAEDDRRGVDRIRQRLAKERISRPHGSSSRNEYDPGDAAESPRHRAEPTYAFRRFAAARLTPTRWGTPNPPPAASPNQETVTRLCRVRAESQASSSSRSSIVSRRRIRRASPSRTSTA